jgi:nicotinamidase-related amidase
LIVYDMQVGIVSQIPDGKVLAERCATLLEAARRFGYPVFFMRHRWLPNPRVPPAQPSTFARSHPRD